MGTEVGRDYLYPPRDGTLKDFLMWVAEWRVVPIISPSLRNHLNLVDRAFRHQYLRQAEGLGGRVIGLTAKGARLVGKTAAAVQRLSLAVLSERSLLHLAAHQLRQTNPQAVVSGFGRNAILVDIQGEELRLGWGSGDIVAGFDRKAQIRVPLPKQLHISEDDLTDAEWAAIYQLLVPPPPQRIKSPFWARTLVDALIAMRSGKHALVREAGGPALLQAAYWYSRKPHLWEGVVKRVPRLARLGLAVRR